jgi:hypothetical protein
MFILQTFEHLLHLLHSDCLTLYLYGAILFKIENNAPKGHKYLHIGRNNKIENKMQLPNTIIFPTEKSSDERVINSSEFCTNNNEIKGKTSNTYFKYRSILSPLNVFIFLGNGILNIKSCIIPNGQIFPQNNLP